MILAEKNGVKKPFSERQWKLMGKNKNGWKQVPPEVESMKVVDKKEEGKSEEPKNENPNSEKEPEKKVEAPESGDEKKEEGKEEGQGGKSSELGMPEAIEAIKKMSVEEAEKFAEGDERKGVTKAIEKLKSEKNEG